MIKRSLDIRLPALANRFRAWRDERAFVRAKFETTPYGFRFGGNKLMESGLFEPEEVTYVRDRLGQSDVFVDIGANIGFYSCLARSMSKQVIAVEPLEYNLKYLYSNLKANGWEDVEVFPLGLSSKPGMAVLYGGGTAASLVSKWAGAPQHLSRVIPLSTLDIILGERCAGKNVFIKMDVEGAEYLTLQGAEKVLKMDPSPIWLLEICLTENHPDGLNPHFGDVFKLFWANGYSARALEANGVRRVTAEDVDEWIETRQRSFGYVSYAFERDTDPTDLAHDNDLAGRVNTG